MPNAHEGEIHAPKESLDVEHDYADRFLSHAIGATEKSIQANVQLREPLDETRVEFDEDQIIVSDVCDEVHLNARRATRGKYE